jgi:thiamine kinase-like enzyme
LQTVLAYAQTARGLNVELPLDVERLIDDGRELDRALGPFKPALCHNDLLATNILDEGHRLWLVDWEYAGLGRPLFDLASVAANNAFPDDLDGALLCAYRGRLDPRELRELRILKVLSYLREALWGAIQVFASEVAFDYRGYADTNFQAYREARARLEV